MSKIVIFSGSGLSKSLADIPTQDTFIEKVFSNKRDEWVVASLKDNNDINIVQECKDPEMLLSYLYYQDKITRGPNVYKGPYKSAIINFRMALNEYLRTEVKKINEKEKNKFEFLLSKIDELTNEKCTIITTNYDLLCESILGDNKYSYCLVNNEEKEKHKILKLHGSINWIEDENHNKKPLLNEHVEGNINLFKNKNAISPPKREGDDFRYVFDNKRYKPVTIPFIYQKDDWYSRRWKEVFEDCIWKKANEELLNSKYIVFIGLGIASADYPILALLNKANSQNKEKIIIINRSAEKFHKYGIRFNYISGKYLQDFEENEFQEWIDRTLRS